MTVCYPACSFCRSLTVTCHAVLRDANTADLFTAEGKSEALASGSTAWHVTVIVTACSQHAKDIKLCLIAATS